MKVKDLIEHLQKNFDPEATLYVGDYYYDMKEGYVPMDNFTWISDKSKNYKVEGNVIYVDTYYPEGY